MSLDILLLAAEFLEWRSKTKTRGNDISTDLSIYEEQVKTSSNASPSPSSSSAPSLAVPPPPPPPPLQSFPLPVSPAPLPSSVLKPHPVLPTVSASPLSAPVLAQSTAPLSPQSSTNTNDLKSKNAEKADKRRAGGAGTREVHNKLEKNRRAHMKEMFEYLKSQIPLLQDKKNSNLSILRSAIRYVQSLKRKERYCERQIQNLVETKISLQEKLQRLKLDSSILNPEISFDFECEEEDEEEEEEEGDEDIDSNSTSTASEGNGPIMSEVEEESLQDTIKEPSPSVKESGKKVPSLITCQALPTILGTSSPKMTSTSNSALIPPTTLLPGSIKPLKNNVGFPTRTTSVIANNTLAAAHAIHNANSTGMTNNSPSLATHRPVAEILHKTLAQRQALHKQLLGNSTSNSREEIAPTQVTTVHSSKPIRTTTHFKPQNSIRSVIPLNTTSVKPGGVQPTTGFKLATLTIPVNKPTKMAITPHKKIVVETSPATVPKALSVTANLTPTSTATPSSTTAVSAAAATVPSALTAIVRTPAAHPIVSQQTVPVVSAVKQIMTPTGPQIVSGSPLAVNPLLSQTIARTQILNTSMLSSSSVSTSPSTSSTPISSIHPVVSLTPVSQLVSPTVHVPSGLPQTAQLNMFPIIQSQLFPTNQVVGQSVTTKPLVMVTVPTTTTTVQLSVAMTPSTTTPTTT